MRVSADHPFGILRSASSGRAELRERPFLTCLVRTRSEDRRLTRCFAFMLAVCAAFFHGPVRAEDSALGVGIGIGYGNVVDGAHVQTLKTVSVSVARSTVQNGRVLAQARTASVRTVVSSSTAVQGSSAGGFGFTFSRATGSASATAFGAGNGSVYGAGGITAQAASAASVSIGGRTESAGSSIAASIASGARSSVSSNGGLSHRR